MSLRALAPCVLLVALFTSSLTNAFNITKILSNTSDFGSFNNFLSQSGLAETINSRSSLTILALDNGAVGSLQGKSNDKVQRILTNHVLLDYIDQNKLKNLPNKTTTMTTLLQASVVAQQGQGFLNVTVSGNTILFGSEVQDSPLAASFVKSVYAEPYNISVLQISRSIVAPGISAPAPYTTLPPPPPSKTAPAPSPMTRKAPPPATAKGKEDTRNTAAAPGRGRADSGAPCALGSGVLLQF
ncbi:fasciclin-like arabinogalactan protein 3 [Pistacia vera]|uniref:fasciclin-like arabinogalactan protein 3 n=1 Tax=Pistacia vera TaxID=55513 RepID=UPI001262D668|nr:fasciclin-like arabinogalactan protein 3 [Pistacia vera]